MVGSIPVPVKGDGNNGLWVPDSNGTYVMQADGTVNNTDVTFRTLATPNDKPNQLWVFNWTARTGASNLQIFVAFGGLVNNALVTVFTATALGGWAIGVGPGVATAALGNYLGGLQIPGGQATIMAVHYLGAYPITLGVNLYTS